MYGLPDGLVEALEDGPAVAGSGVGEVAMSVVRIACRGGEAWKSRTCIVVDIRRLGGYADNWCFL